MARYFKEESDTGKTLLKAIGSPIDGKVPSAKAEVYYEGEKYTPNFLAGGLIEDKNPFMGYNADATLHNLTGLTYKSARHIVDSPGALDTPRSLEVANNINSLQQTIYNLYSPEAYTRRKAQGENQEEFESFETFAKRKRITGISLGKQFSQFRKDSAEGLVPTPTTLFEHHPEKMNVLSMHADPTMRPQAITMLALGHMDRPNSTIVADSSLSSFSSKLSQNAVNRGFPVVGNPANPEMKQTNEQSFYNAPERLNEDTVNRSIQSGLYGEEYPVSRVQQTRQHMRALRKKGVIQEEEITTTPTTNPNQMQFPGMEKY